MAVAENAASKLDGFDKVREQVLASDQPKEVLQPRLEPFYFPAAIGGGGYFVYGGYNLIVSCGYVDTGFGKLSIQLAGFG